MKLTKNRLSIYSQLNLLIWTLIFSFQSIAQPAQNQIPQAISLELALQMAGANNLTLQHYILQQELADAELNKSKEWWLPQIYGGVQTHKLMGAAMNTDGKYGLDLNRDNLWAGLGLDISWEISEGIYQKKSAKFKSEAIGYSNQAERNKTLLNIIDHYYDFLLAQLTEEAYGQLIIQADTLSKQLKIQSEAGLRYQSEYLLATSNLNHFKIKSLESSKKKSMNSANLIAELNLDPNVQLIAVDSIMIPLESLSEDIDWEMTYQRRPELSYYDLQLKAMNQEKKMVTTGLLIPDFRLNTYGSYSGDLNNPVDPLDPVQFPETSQLYYTNEVNISLMWQIPIGHFIQKGDLKKYKAKISIGENQRQQFKNQVNKEILSYRSVLDISKLQLDLADESSEFAEAALSQAIQRQELGTVRPFEILQAQEIYIKAKLDRLKAVSDYNKAFYRLSVAKGNNL